MGKLKKYLRVFIALLISVSLAVAFNNCSNAKVTVANLDSGMDSNILEVAPVSPDEPDNSADDGDLVIPMPEVVAVPKALVSLSAESNSASAIVLNWSLPTGQISSIIVLRSTSLNSGYQQIASLVGNSVSYVDIGLNQGTTYYYKVYLTNISGNGPVSSVNQMTMAAETSVPLPPDVEPVAPLAPNNVQVVAVSAIKIQLSWDMPEQNVSNINIQRSINGINFSSLVDLSGSSNGYNDNLLTPGTHYYYKIRFTNSDSLSTTSEVYSAETPILAPPAPTSLAGVVNSTSQISLSWQDNADNESAYIVKRSLSADSSFQTIATLAANVESFNDSQLNAGTTYYYKVYAYNITGHSEASNLIQLKTQSSFPTASNLLAACAAADSSSGSFGSSEFELVTEEIQKQIPDPGECSWGSDGNDDTAQGIAVARREQAYAFFTANSAPICNVSAVSTSSAHTYEDNILFMLNNRIIGSSAGEYNSQFTSDNGSFIYNWADLKGSDVYFNNSSAYCLSDSANACVLQSSGSSGQIKLENNAEDIQKIIASTQLNKAEFKVVTVGDNDSVDCHHSELNFTVKITYLKRK